MIGVGAAGPPGGERDASRWRGLSLVEPDRSTRAADERAAWICLASIAGVGPVGFAAVLHRFGTAETALESSAAEVVGLLPRADAQTGEDLRRVQHRGWRTVASRLEDEAHRAGGTVLTALDAGYPVPLSLLGGRPPVLYLLGPPEALAPPAVAVVGTRRPTGYGLTIAADISDEIARAGVTVVSGLALGIDGRAHLAALDAGGRTVAVLPSPIDRVYPPRHRALAARIVAEEGALVSESPPGRLSGKPDFARRNRIISGLAEATVVIEAPDRSGALLTASAAQAQGRDVYAVPGPIDSVASRGCNRLIADHVAELVTSPASLLHRLGLGLSSVPADHVVATLSEAEGLVLGALIKRSGSIEELGTRSQLATPALASALTLLEARGLVASYGGVTFHATLAARRIGNSGSSR